MAGNCGQPLRAESSPRLAASEKTRPSVLQLQERNTATHCVSSEEDLELRKECSLADTLTTACETLSRRPS